MHACRASQGLIHPIYHPGQKNIIRMGINLCSLSEGAYRKSQNGQHGMHIYSLAQIATQLSLTIGWTKPSGWHAQTAAEADLDLRLAGDAHLGCFLVDRPLEAC